MVRGTIVHTYRQNSIPMDMSFKKRRTKLHIPVRKSTGLARIIATACSITMSSTMPAGSVHGEVAHQSPIATSEPALSR